MLRLERALVAALSICILLAAWQLPFSAACTRLREDTLRLHVLANSDTEQDQQLKLAVRDALLQELAVLAAAENKQQALAQLAKQLPQLTQTAQRVLRQNGCAHSVRVRICDMWFSQRSYGDATLPAGRYTALRVEIGQAAGQNWWCVLYPALCLPAAAGQEELEGWDAQEEQLVFGEGYEVRFWLEELLQRIAGKVREA
ncbi:MAG: stage II sporulation protein R [Oscillospiraceae bacterium]|nr:stage II sporulation protein R [Oscillospiraceae bacterium]